MLITTIKNIINKFLVTKPVIKEKYHFHPLKPKPLISNRAIKKAKHLLNMKQPGYGCLSHERQIYFKIEKYPWNKSKFNLVIYKPTKNKYSKGNFELKLMVKPPNQNPIFYNTQSYSFIHNLDKIDFLICFYFLNKLAD